MAKQPGGVAARVEKLVRPVVEEMGLRLWDVRFDKEGAEWFLKVLIDRPGAVMDTDTCEAASRAIDPLLDAEDPIDQAYYLEVGSPGLGRKLTRPEHYEALEGEKIAVKRYRADEAGRKEVKGILLGLSEDVLRLETEDGEVALPLKEAASVKLCDDEDLFG